MQFFLRRYIAVLAAIAAFCCHLQLITAWKISSSTKKFVAAVFIPFSVMVQELNLHEAIAAPLQQYGLKKGRLLSCQSMGNCISTSSVDSVEKYGRPWEFSNPSISTEDQYKKIIEVVNNDPFLKLTETNPEKLYIHAEAKSAVPPTGTDDIEFLLNGPDRIITYRSNSRDVITVGFQQPLGDGGSNQNRLEAIRRKLGVSEMKLSDAAEDYIKEVNKRGLLQIMQEASEPNDINFLDNSVPQAE